jgi:acetylornithine deacetylase/succinyl-diaminopimelate desuccinylase-like protein
VPLSLADFEQLALPTLETYATIPCQSPNFDADWATNGHIDAAVDLLAAFANERTFAAADVTIHRLEGRTPVLCVTVEATTDDEETADDRGTVVLYGHLDKQPPLGEWSEGLDPYVPVRRGDRLYGRGLADDGYSTFSALLAIEALETAGVPHPRCVVLIEACEESGSPDLEAYLDYLAPKLGQVELMICLDSGALTYDRLWVTTSLRGVVMIDVAIEVLERGMHSGLASGVVPSSFRVLRQLLDRIEDPATGEILLPELHCDIPEHVRAAAETVAGEFGDIASADMPAVEGLQFLGEPGADRIIRRTWKPTLSVVGMAGIPPLERAGSVLRPFTTATLSLRLPPLVDAHSALAAVERVLTTDVPHGAKVTLSRPEAADGWASPTLQPWLLEALDEASSAAFGTVAGYTGEGGTIPFLASLGRRYPGVQFVATGVLGPEANAHGIDEMLDLPTAVGVTNAVSTILAAFTQRSAR